MALLTEEKASIVEKYKRNDGDTGSPEVQIALLTENINNQKESLEQSSIEKKVLEGSIDSNYDLNLADGIEAYYSERYGWTLRRKTI